MQLHVEHAALQRAQQRNGTPWPRSRSRRRRPRRGCTRRRRRARPRAACAAAGRRSRRRRSRRRSARRRRCSRRSTRKRPRRTWRTRRTRSLSRSCGQQLLIRSRAAHEHVPADVGAAEVVITSVAQYQGEQNDPVPLSSSAPTNVDDGSGTATICGSNASRSGWRLCETCMYLDSRHRIRTSTRYHSDQSPPILTHARALAQRDTDAHTYHLADAQTELGRTWISWDRALSLSLIGPRAAPARCLEVSLSRARSRRSLSLARSLSNAGEGRRGLGRRGSTKVPLHRRRLRKHGARLAVKWSAAALSVLLSSVLR